MPQFLDATDASFEASFAALLSAKREDSPDVDAVVADLGAEPAPLGEVGFESAGAVLDLDDGVAEAAEVGPLSAGELGLLGTSRGGEGEWRG